jgi:zinc/manganese transport system ATP-binding protein
MRREAKTAVTNSVRCEQVTLAHGHHIVLRDVSFAIEEGEFIGLFGANGAGKTTLLKALAGVLCPLSGNIAIAGNMARPGHPAIGYMPQSRAMTAQLSYTAQAYLAAGARAGWGMCLTSRAVKREILDALALTGAENFARRPLNSLSGGERQRVMLALAILCRPKVLLLDEPLINLDPARQQEVVTLIKMVQRETAATVIFAAHELNPLRWALDRVLYLGQGEAALGSVDEVFTPRILSRLYGADIEVVQAGSHIFVMAAGADIEALGHDHGGCGHDHAVL